jgi:hypothetical protein
VDLFRAQFDAVGRGYVAHTGVGGGGGALCARSPGAVVLSANFQEGGCGASLPAVCVRAVGGQGGVEEEVSAPPPPPPVLSRSGALGEAREALQRKRAAIIPVVQVAGQRDPETGRVRLSLLHTFPRGLDDVCARTTTARAAHGEAVDVSADAVAGAEQAGATYSCVDDASGGGWQLLQGFLPLAPDAPSHGPRSEDPDSGGSTGRRALRPWPPTSYQVFSLPLTDAAAAVAAAGAASAYSQVSIYLEHGGLWRSAAQLRFASSNPYPTHILPDADARGWRDGCAGPMHVVDFNVTVETKCDADFDNGLDNGHDTGHGTGQADRTGESGVADTEDAANEGATSEASPKTCEGASGCACPTGDDVDDDDEYGRDDGVVVAPPVSFVLGGFPKTGTSTLWFTLGFHPGIPDKRQRPDGAGPAGGR